MLTQFKKKFLTFSCWLNLGSITYNIIKQVWTQLLNSFHRQLLHTNSELTLKIER